MKPARKRKAHFTHGSMRITVTESGLTFRKKHARVSTTMRWPVVLAMGVGENKNGQLSVFDHV